ncbi:hypothetical protein HPB49_024840 [Dermacentor silvarum]|uniref:Uncharacterized protein n=1 Tax=Dermacentor silvarum TaxID=543639 RepID=A0ACB8CCE6_DERSI|nr:hypothetical protein HPB49_024840 [Dermacentor silvarum]
MDVEVTAEMGWRTTRLRQPAKLSVDSSPESQSTQTSSTRSRSKTRPLVKAQVLKAGRLPPLPSKEIKIIIRPKRALNIAKIGSPTVTTAVFQAAQLSPAHIQQDTVCPNTQQNIVVASTPRPQNADRYVCITSIQVSGVTHDVNAYETAAEDTTKGVIREIPLSDTPQQINANIVNTCNPLALGAKRIGTTTIVVIAFSGPDVPYLICRGCGVRNPPPDRTCNPKCSLCSGPHVTAGKSCTARYKTPYVIRKRIGERRAATQVTLQESDFPPMNYKHHSRSRSPSRSRQHCSRTPSRSRQRRSRSRSTSTPPAKPPTNKFSQGVRDLKQSKIPAPTPPAEASPSSSHDAPLTPAPKKRALQKGVAGQDLDLTFITDPTFPTRLDNSTCRDTTPDVTLTKNVTNTQWSNTQHDLRSDHFIIAILIPPIAAVTAKPREFTWLDWDAFGKHRSADPHAERIADIDAWTRNLQSDTEAPTHTITTDAPVERMDSILTHLLTAKTSSLSRWKGQRLNRHLRAKIALLNKEI